MTTDEPKGPTRTSEPVEDATGNRRCVAAVLEQDGELVAAEPGHQGSGIDHLGDARRDL